MRNLSFLSDTDSDSNSESAGAVNDLLSQTKDLCVLEQVSAINCASFSADSVLASDLESRFARLKSFPAAPTTTTTQPPPTAAKAKANANARTATVPAPPNPAGSKSFGSESESPSSPAEGKTKRVDSKNSKNRRSRSFTCSEPSSPARRNESSADSSAMGCSFWCSPKKGMSASASGRRKKEIREVDWGRGSDFGWSRNEEILEDLGSFTVEEQRKILRKAMAEQKKISSEARKIVKMAKKASSVGKTTSSNGAVDDHDLFSSD